MRITYICDFVVSNIAGVRTRMSQPCSLHCYNNNIPSFKIKQQLPFFGSLGSLICDAHMDIHLKINHEPPLIFLTSFIFDYWIYDVHKDIYTDIHIKKKQSWTPLTWKKYIFEITDFVTHIYTNIHLKNNHEFPLTWNQMKFSRWLILWHTYI